MYVLFGKSTTLFDSASSRLREKGPFVRVGFGKASTPLRESFEKASRQFRDSFDPASPAAEKLPKVARTYLELGNNLSRNKYLACPNNCKLSYTRLPLQKRIVKRLNTYNYKNINGDILTFHFLQAEIPLHPSMKS